MSLELKIKKKLKEFTLQAEISSADTTTALLGASGSGKSMILKCIAGIETPDEGYIRVNGVALFDSAKKINLKPQKRKVGILFQNYALFPNFTVTQNIACGLKKKNPQKIQELLAKFSLTEIAQHYGEQLSGGQQQRVALARLLASEPQILLLDEPFSALDTFLKDKVELELKNFIAEYTGDVVLVTHNRNEAYRLCENLVILERGQTLEKGILKEIFAQPHYLATSKLTGCKNFSRLKVLGPDKIHALDWGIELLVAAPIPPDVTHLGVRAHYFYAATPDQLNAFPIEVVDRGETPFEWHYYCQTGTASEPIWWEFEQNSLSKNQTASHIAVKPSDIQLLKSLGDDDGEL